MLISSKQRKFVHFSLFFIVIILKIIILSFLYKELKNQESLQLSFSKINKSNDVLILSNLATNHYFQANNYFNEYLNTRSDKVYLKYQDALKKMAFDFENLSKFTNTSLLFKKIIKNKVGAENEVVRLKNEFDFLINKNKKADFNLKLIQMNLKTFEYEKILSSITYDTTKTVASVKKKGFFGRIGNALSGKNQVEKQTTQSVIKMVFNNQEKSGSFEEQLKNIFLITEKHYEKQFQNLKIANNKLRVKDSYLLNTNKLILQKSQNILQIYATSAEKLNLLILKQTEKNIENSNKKKKQLLSIMLIALSISTLLLLFYTVYSYIRERVLENSILQVEKSNRDKNQLIGYISHEMRAPLEIISKQSKIIKNSNTNPLLNKTVNSLHFTSGTLQITINQILDFFKNQNKEISLNKSKVNLLKHIESIVESLRSLAESKNLIIHLNCIADLNHDFWIDSIKIQQLFNNIIGNSIKFSNRGSIKIDVDLNKTNDKYRLDVKISDNGIGIPSDEISRVFDTHYQSKNSKDKIGFGAGLGLSICKEIIEKHDGKINIKSIVNEGTEISFYLLIEDVSEKLITNEDKLKKFGKLNNPKVLVLDDDSMILLLVQKLFVNLNFEVHPFINPHEAKYFLENNTVNLVITDLNIKSYSGIDFIKFAKNLNSNDNLCPILLMTGDYSVIENIASFPDINDVVLKPIEKEALHNTIIKVLGIK